MTEPGKISNPTLGSAQNLQVQELKISFHRGVAARHFKRPLLDALYPLKFFHREKVGFHFSVNLRKIAVYTDDSVKFSYRHASL